jgi:hypothetical protein
VAREERQPFRGTNGPEEKVDRQQENGFMRHNQNRRSRGRNNNRKGPNPLTRSYESNGPDVKVRGTAAHVADKYMTLARDAQSSGDTVAAENYLQHAEHYYRIVMAAQAQFQQSQPQFREGPEDTNNYDDDRQVNGRPRDRFDFNGADGRNDDEGDDRFDNNGGGEGDDDRGYRPPMQQQGRPHGEDNRPRGPRPEQRYDRPRYDNRDNRDNRDNGGRDRQDNRDNRDNGGRHDRQEYRDNGNRQERYQRAEEPQPELPPQPPVEAVAPPPPPAPEEAAPPPRRRRGRPPRAEAEQAAEGETPDGAAALAAFPD